jgi:hypothetical protein
VRLKIEQRRHRILRRSDFLCGNPPSTSIANNFIRWTNDLLASSTINHSRFSEQSDATEGRSRLAGWLTGLVGPG